AHGHQRHRLRSEGALRVYFGGRSVPARRLLAEAAGLADDRYADSEHDRGWSGLSHSTDDVTQQRVELQPDRKVVDVVDDDLRLRAASVRAAHREPAA